jgi:hypothetical protein
VVCVYSRERERRLSEWLVWTCILILRELEDSYLTLIALRVNNTEAVEEEAREHEWSHNDDVDDKEAELVLALLHTTGILNLQVQQYRVDID